jgi:hypothetical protein
MNNIKDGYSAACIYKYYSQYINSNVVKIIPEHKITAKSLYKLHKSTFDKLTYFFLTNNLNLRNYIKFIVLETRPQNNTIDSILMSKYSFNLFASHLSIKEKYEKIYNWYIKTVKNIAEFCLDSECISAADFIRKLIKDRKLAAWVISGKLSAYYLSAIPCFPKIIEKLDSISKDELMFISNKYDIYNTEINKAILLFEKRKANAIKDANEMIEKLRPAWNEKNKNKDLFDPSLN